MNHPLLLQRLATKGGVRDAGDGVSVCGGMDQERADHRYVLALGRQQNRPHVVFNRRRVNLAIAILPKSSSAELDEPRRVEADRRED